MNQWKVLVVDDEEPIRKILKSRFEREGWQTITCASADEAEKILHTDSAIAVIVTDVRMPGKDGIVFLTEQKAIRKDKKYIVMTGHGEKSTAVGALKNGACDYLEKPFEIDEMSHAVQRALREFGLERYQEQTTEILKARAARAESLTTPETWFESNAVSMKPALEWLHVLRRESMNLDAPEPSILLLGESGTGKEGIARLIHRQSRRGNGPWVALNCANFSEQLLESELFGHERGAFTGATTQKRGLVELANGGTLFLDEVGEMDQKIQARLLRLLQEKKYRRVGGNTEFDTDIRIIAATNRNLGTETSEGRFREDLYHRLAGVVITIPPLRTRTEDLVPMARYFAEKAFRHRGKKFDGFTTSAENWITSYGWTGNVREMINTIERCALVWNRQGNVDVKDLQGPSMPGAPALRAVSDSEMSVRFLVGPESFTTLKKQFADEFERQYLLRALDRHNGNVSAAAKESKIDRSNFLRLLRRHVISAQEYRKAA